MPVTEESSSSTVQETYCKVPNGVAETHVSIEMEFFYSSLTAKLKESFRFNFESPSEQSQKKVGSIPLVPQSFHRLKEPSAYMPDVISIGPFHRGKGSFKGREHIKLLFAHNIIARKVQTQEEGPPIRLINQSGRPVTAEWFEIYKKCVEEIQKDELKIRQYYSEPVELDSRDFVEMMVIDGLFIVGLLLRFHDRSGFLVEDGPLHYNRLLRIGVTRDLLVLENQLPFSVLQSLFEIIRPENINSTPFITIAHKFLQHFISKSISPTETSCVILEDATHLYKDATHLLDLLAMLLRPTSDEATSVAAASNDLSVFIPSATDLNRAGVKFKKGNKNLMDVKFTSNGVFEIPPVLIFDDSDQIFRNLIAYEQLYNGGSDMSSYAMLMDSLINSAEDVEVLRKAGILGNNLGCDQDVSNMFNKLCFAIDVEGNRYSQIKLDVNGYYNRKKHLWKATLKRDYFNGPWAITSFFAAFLLLSLTILSATYTILQYYYRR